MRGAYGLRIEGIDPPAPLVEPIPSTWTPVRLERRVADVGDEPPRLDTDGTVVLRLLAGGYAVLHRESTTATYVTPEPLTDQDLVHPYLAAVGEWFARWLGRQPLHAGAFVAGGRAWALLGENEAGKSTLLAQLHLAGQPILTDDLLVVEDGTALAGPRCLDLRGPTARRLDQGSSLSQTRAGSRRRLMLPAVDAELPLGGWIFLEWGEDELVRLTPAQRLEPLNRFRMAHHPADDPEGVLDLAGLASWVYRRPRNWDALAHAPSRLLASISDA